MSGDLLFRVAGHLDVLYPGNDNAALAAQLLSVMQLTTRAHEQRPPPHRNLWDQTDVALITYGDSFLRTGEAPLQTLDEFLRRFIGDAFSIVHILPFFPYSSDDGFAVYEYTSVSQALGGWEDISRIAKRYRLMADVVINHCSSRSLWFENFKQDVEPGRDYFITAEEDIDLSRVVRPRTSALLRPTETVHGIRHVWCTFSHDQVDLDFRNPAVLIEFVRIIALYLERGVRLFRLDAVAFVWKEIGTPCINLPQTHELVRLLRTLLEAAADDAVVITETNIPSQENLSYFGNANEAHAIYNFSLPPLLLNSLITGNCHHLKTWMMSMPPAQQGTFYLNFIASHDGIGLRPTEGLLEHAELDRLLATMQAFGGRVSWRALEDGAPHPYEINISLFDALQGTCEGRDDWQLERFVCAHAIMLALEGIPAFYVHSLLGTGNDYTRMEHSGHNRHINRHQWDYQQLQQLMARNDSVPARVSAQLLALIRLRQRQPAFHPNAQQFLLHLSDQVFAFWRQSLDGNQAIFCLNNISAQPQVITLADLNLEEGEWIDLISGRRFSDERECLELAPYQVVWLSNG